MAGEIYVARTSASLAFGAGTVFLQQGVTLARAGHPVLDVAGEMFEPVFVHFEVEEDPEEDNPPEQPQSADPAESGPLAPPAPVPPPAPADVRTWAAEQGIDVPAKGRIPAGVVEAYQAAHQEA